MSENIDGNDLRHTFSDFNTVKAKGKTSLKHELNNIPVIGEEASTKGILKLISGSKYDCNHLDKFLNSNLNNKVSKELKSKSKLLENNN